jgi:hypothetical protein
MRRLRCRKRPALSLVMRRTIKITVNWRKQMATIHDIAREFDRIAPWMVDDSIAGNGEREAGHLGHEKDGGYHSVGHSAGGGTCGEQVCTVPVARIDELHSLLCQIAQEEEDAIESQLRNAVLAFGGEW